MRDGFFVLVVLFLLSSIATSIPLADAQVRSSPSYQIQSDSINFGGGYSSSTNYIQESTFGEVATGEGSSTNYIIGAGYQQMQVVYLALTEPSDVVLSPAIGGLTGGESNGSTTVVATSDSPSGYQLTMAFSDDPAMQSSNDTIADYEPSGSAPDYTFTTAANDAHFGFSPYGADVPARYQNNTTVCDTGSTITAEACWDTPSTTDQVIAASQSGNHPIGATTTIYFKVGVGNQAAVTGGTYTATTTLTLLSL